ncbi:MAG: non-ribosomal peptide synthetase component F, partial [Planctomycetota bacterium]
PGFGELQRRVQKSTLGAWAHQDLPLSHILREVAPDRDLSRNPLFQVQFSLLTPDHNPAVYGYGLSSGNIEKVALGDLAMTPVDVHYDNARYDIAAFLWDMPQGIQGTIEYSSDLFNPETIANLVERFQSVLTSIVKQPEARLDTLVAELDQLEMARKAETQKAFKKSMNKGLKSIKRRKSSASSAEQSEKPKS